MIAVIYIPPFHHHDAFQTAFLHGTDVRTPACSHSASFSDLPHMPNSMFLIFRLVLSQHTSSPVLPAASRHTAGYFWLPQLASFIFIFGYNETVKWFFRNRPDGTVSRLLRW